MNSRQVIADAWQFTRQHRKLMWWYAFLPSLLTTLIGIIYITYQFFAFKNSSLFGVKDKSFLTDVLGTAIRFFESHGTLTLPFIIVTIIILLLYALLPTLCQGALIKLTARARHGEEVRVLDGISLGMLSFLPLLEYHLLIKTFSIVSLFTEAGFVIRNLGPSAITTILPLFLFVGVVAFVLSLLFTYSEFFIVLEKKPILTAMGRSAKLVIVSWQHTFIIGILMLLIGARIILNVLAVMIVPALLFFGVGFFATISGTLIGIVIGATVSGAALLIASYFTGIFNIFANAVWTFTFLELMQKKETQEILS